MAVFMNLSSAIGAVAGLVIYSAVVWLVLRGRLNVRFSGLWLMVGLLVAVLAVAPELLTRLSRFLGFSIPSNFLFFIAVVFLSLLSLQVSMSITSLDKKVQRLAEEIAILRERDPGVDGDGSSP